MSGRINIDASKAVVPDDFSVVEEAGFCSTQRPVALPVVDYDRLLYHAKVVGNDRLRGVDVDSTRHGVHKEGKGSRGTRKRERDNCRRVGQGVKVPSRDIICQQGEPIWPRCARPLLTSLAPAILRCSPVCVRRQPVRSLLARALHFVALVLDTWY